MVGEPSTKKFDDDRMTIRLYCRSNTILEIKSFDIT